MAMRGWTVLGLVAALASAGCAGEDLQSKYEQANKELLDTTSRLEDTKQQRAEAEAKAESLAQAAKQADMEAEKARQAAEALAKEKDDLRAQVLAQKNAKSPSSSVVNNFDTKGMQALVEQIKRELAGSASSVGLTKDGNIEITLASDVTFGSGSAELSKTGKESIKALAPLLKGKFAPYQVRVEGHTDATPLNRTKPKYSDNFGLGSARSLAVVRFMETEMGIEPTRLMSASRGEHDPKADNKSDTGKKQNRRVEVVVVVPHDAALSMAK